MNSFLNPHNSVSLTGLIDIIAHNISLFQENENPKNINGIFIPKSDISVAEPYDVQIDELGDKHIIVYQSIGPINDSKVGGLEILLNYMNEISFSKDDPAVNEHHYHITRKRYKQDFSTHIFYNIDKSKSYKKSYHNFNDSHFNTKQQFVTNEVTNYITKSNNIHNTENILIVKRLYNS